MKISRQVGNASEVLTVFIQNFTVSTGVGLANVSASSVNFAWCRNNMAAISSGVCTAGGTLGTYSVSTLTQLSSTSTLGWYQFSPPDIMFLSGRSAILHLYGYPNMAPVPIEVELTATNNQSILSVNVSGMTVPVGVSSASVLLGVSTLSVPVGVSSYSRDAGVSTIAVAEKLVGVSTIAAAQKLVGVSTMTTPVGVSSASVNFGVSTLATSVSSVTGSVNISSYSTLGGVSTVAVLVGVSTLATPVGVSSASVDFGVSTLAVSEKLVGVSTMTTPVGVSSASVNLGVSTLAADVNVSSINGAAVTGTGISSDLWRGA